ncbi:cadherin-like beta sandwich domain-containing protein [Clostridium chromiireducens]|uniref:Cell wall-binding protein n=1 Tax=Clostridium chromiireducens TaxID=225345 RepID=A0A1V4IF41_9CLOT|nr:cadherin-like beta sandwich domain-containing protein [Clostridium chromiireducens]MVX63907.1 cell wall-binding protein [Clostridium chromiireducens]OPJ58628.1 putative endo-beta-N-acetylglucosaminidase precursor [Clostridium chromiireducens]
MSKTLRSVAIAIIISIFTIIGPEYFNFIVVSHVYADELPHLKNIYFSEGKDIEFLEDVYSYIVDVDKDTDEAFIKAKPDDPLDTVRIDGKVVTKDDNYKENIALKKGKNTIKIEVEDKKTGKSSEYKVYVYRGGQEAVYLQDININSTTIGFAEETNFYNIELDDGTTSVELETKPIEGNYSIAVNGKLLDKTNSIRLKFKGIGKYTLNIGVKDEDTQRLGAYTLNIYLGIPVTPNIADSINAALKPNQWIIVNGRWKYNDVLGKYLKNTWFYDDKLKAYFHFNNRGNMQTDWMEDGGNWYYLGTNGMMQTGWVYYEGEWYYLDSQGVMRTGWIEDNNNWYYLRRDGSMATGWIVNKDNWYYIDSHGVMQTGWLYYGKRWYLIDSSGVMNTRWIKVDSEWYYFNDDGSMKSGEWLYDNGNWYYINYAGNMRRGWLYKDDKYYYFNEDGSMRTSSKTIDGYTYYFNENGSVNFNY